MSPWSGRNTTHAIPKTPDDAVLIANVLGGEAGRIWWVMRCTGTGPKELWEDAFRVEEAGILETHQHADVGYGPGRFTGDTALRLAHLFGTSAQLWPNLQSLYDLRLAQEKVGKSIKAFPTLKRRELAHA